MGNEVAELTRTTRWLLAALTDLRSQLPLRGRLLDGGSAEGHAARLWAEQGGSAAFCHYELDICRRAAASCEVSLEKCSPEKRAAEGSWLSGYNGPLSITFTDLVPAGPYDFAVFDTHKYEREYALEMIGHIASQLDEGGGLLSVVDGTISSTVWMSRLNECFGEVKVLSPAAVQADGLDVFLARWPKPDTEPEIDYYPWPMAIDGEMCQFFGAPGVFSPKGLDAGTAFMLEIMDISPNDVCLDLGCGTGAVAVAAGKKSKMPVVAVDTNARALRLTQRNSELNLVRPVQVQPSDGLMDISPDIKFDVIASNPPYHTDFAVARRFIEGSLSRLRPGGRLYLVVKRSDWYEQKLRSVFGGCRKFSNESGYTVLVAEHRGKWHVPPRAGKRPTRKHLKRVEESKRRKRRYLR
ncbi:MAG: methyltransferase [Firmicutes bacterium]|jgi:16S rRNA (guanine1207-N2)-methyltransferase|nr:methyltransferase [Bacillota bacterium]